MHLWKMLDKLGSDDYRDDSGPSTMIGSRVFRPQCTGFFAFYRMRLIKSGLVMLVMDALLAWKYWLQE
jgi:hypothetical protein